MEPAPSVSLGKYELLKRIAAGGMAEIFVARVRGLPGFEKILCIKRILPQLAQSSEFVDMFLDEARIAATLHHPNIVQMYDVGEAEGSYFISMEYLFGVDVRTLIKGMRAAKQWIPLEHALHVIIGMCAGLHYAHEKHGFDGKALGIVHRDVNPQNVFVTFDGGVKIVDFGIAKATNRFNETRAGTLKGKIPYMSPEQCTNEPLDRRSDIFAIGIMLYELTTGYRLYKGTSEFEVLKKIVEGTVVPPRQLRPEMSPALEEIILRALTKERKLRYQTARELQADLEGYAREQRLPVSSIALSSWVQSLFPNRIEAWREAQAKGSLGAEQLAEIVPSRPGGGADDEDEELVVAAEQLDTVTVAGTPRPRNRLDGDSAPGVPAGPEVVVFDAEEPPPVARHGRRGRAIAAIVVAVAAAGVVATVVMAGGSKKTAAPATDAAPIARAEPVDAAPVAIAPADAAPVAAVEPDAAPTVVADAHADAGPRPHHHEKEPVGPPGELRIASTPSCEVLVDGKARGSTPLAGVMLPPGKHKVQLVNSRFGIDKTFTVEVKSGEVTKKKWDLSAAAPP